MHVPIPALLRRLPGLALLRRLPGFRRTFHRLRDDDASHGPGVRGGRDRLDPVGGRWRLRRGPTARLGLATLLLLTAAGALYADGGPDTGRTGAPSTTPRPGTPLSPPASPTASPGGTVTDPESGARWLDPPRDASPSRRTVPSGHVGVPIRLADPTRLAGVAPGDRVDLYAVRAEAPGRTSAPPRADGASTTGDEAAAEEALIAEGALVLAVDRAAAALQLALAPPQGESVMAAPGGTTYAVVVRPASADASAAAEAASRAPAGASDPAVSPDPAMRTGDVT